MSLHEDGSIYHKERHRVYAKRTGEFYVPIQVSVSVHVVTRTLSVIFLIPQFLMFRMTTTVVLADL